MIEVFIDGVKAKLISFELLTSGSKGSAIVHFRFSDEWETKYKYYDKFACFDNGIGIYSVLLNGDAVEIPPEALAVPGVYLKTGIYAVCPREKYPGILAVPTVGVIC